MHMNWTVDRRGAPGEQCDTKNACRGRRMPERMHIHSKVTNAPSQMLCSTTRCGLEQYSTYTLVEFYDFFYIQDLNKTHENRTPS